MSADRLREAATMLRTRAVRATPGGRHLEIEHHQDHGGADTYHHLVAGDGVNSEHLAEFDSHEADAELAATMTPTLAVCLAQWLDDAAQDFEIWGEHDRDIRKPLELANEILGTSS